MHRQYIAVCLLGLALGCVGTSSDGPPDGEIIPAPLTPAEVLAGCAPVWEDAPPEGRVHVLAGSPAGGDGTISSPFRSVLDGLAAARVGGERSLAVGPGTYPASFVLSETFGDNGLVVEGCGIGITVLSAQTDPTTQLLLPTLNITGVGTVDIEVADLTLSGGRPNLLLQDGAGAGGPVSVRRVEALGSIRFGVVVADLETSATFTDVTVSAVLEDGGEYGWGFSVQNGAPYGGGPAGLVTLDGVTIQQAVEVGFFADGANVILQDVTVNQTQSRTADGLRGRGVQIQNHSTASLEDVSITDSSDVGLFIHKPGRVGSPVTITNCSVSGAIAANLNDPDGTTTGDGLVVTRGDSGLDISEHLVIANGLSLSGADRATGIIDGALLQIGGASILVDGTLHPMVEQEGGMIQDLAGGPPPFVPVTRPVGDPLMMDAQSLLVGQP